MYYYLNIFFLLQGIYCELIQCQRMEIVDEMYSLHQDVMRFNQRVDMY